MNPVAAGVALSPSSSSSSPSSPSSSSPSSSPSLPSSSSSSQQSSSSSSLPVTRAEALSRVEAALAQVARQRGGGTLEQATAPLLSAKAAKRVRPRLLLSFAELAGVPLDDPRVVAAACAVELIHSASLLHDDVVDEAVERRGLPSANARFGNHAAVLAGDHVLASAMKLLAFDARAMQAAVEVVLQMSSSAIREIEARGRVDVSEAELADIAVGKTGALFGLCGTLAGTLAAVLLDDARDLGARFATAGIELGLAFQIADDAGDVDDDLAQRTPSVPMARAFARDRALAGEVARLWSSGAESPSSSVASAAAAARLRPLCAQLGREVAAGHVERGLACIAGFRGREAADEIERFARALVGSEGGR